MLKNYLKVAVRSLARKPLFSLILILGLACGLSAVFLIYTYVYHELSYDQYHPKAEQLYRVYTANYDSDKDIYTYKDAMSFNLSGPTLTEEIPELTDFARVFDVSSGLNIRVNNEVLQEKEAMFVDSGFVKLFKINWITGNSSALKDTYSVILTKKAAHKYFGDQDPIGKMLEVTSGQFQGTYQVNGLIEDTPSNTHLYFDMLISYPTLWQSDIEPNWNNFVDYTYFRAIPGANLETLNNKLFPLSIKYLSETTSLRFQLQKVTDIHLHSSMSYEAEINGDANTVYFLSVIALFILIIAWINYINLSTAKAMERAREVGMRKVVGATRFSLIIQFITEATVINFMAVSLALIMAAIILPWYNDFAGTDFPSPFYSKTFILLALGVFIAGTLLSGFYPALVQSSFKTSNVLKGQFKTSRIGFILRKTLVIFQFTASIFLIAGTIVVYEQIQYMQHTDKGMNLEQVIVLPTNAFNFQGDSLSDEHFKIFRNSLISWPQVQHVSTSSSIPAGGTSNIGSVSGGVWWDKNKTEERYTYYISSVDDAFIPTYEINLLAGRNFSNALSSDTGRVVIINEAARKLLTFNNPDEAINEYISIPRQGGRDKHQVIGVIQNFNRLSLKFEVEPTIYFYNAMEDGIYYSVKTSSLDYRELLPKIESAWKTQFPDKPFEYFFADNTFYKQYKSDLQFGKVFTAFSILAIMISCLGLYGLAHFMVLNKTKEIGIRKSLGATVKQIVILLSKSFLQLGIIAFLLSLPLVWWLMNIWLESYANHTSVQWWMFGVTAILVFVIILLTVSYHTIRAARTNPVETLRTE